MDAYQNLYRRALRAVAERPITEVVKRTRAIVGPPLADLEGEARAGMEALKQGQRPTADQVAALQAIIRSMRPSVLSHAGAVDDLPAETRPVFPQWDEFRGQIVRSLYTIGRIDRRGKPPEPPTSFGTGFLVDTDLLLTNHHVVTELTNGTDVVRGDEAEVRFVMEYGSPDEAAVPITGVVQFHEEMDAAVLRVSKSDVLKDRVPLPWSNVGATQEDRVVVVGYPFPDNTRNPLFVDQIFGRKFEIKRLAPGEVLGSRNGEIYHDCSTLGGNSGSPLVDMTTTEVIGLHHDGYFLARNEATSCDALREFIRDVTGA
jgi:V8-like Glu-specific endopeptidase